MTRVLSNRGSMQLLTPVDAERLTPVSYLVRQQLLCSANLLATAWNKCSELQTYSKDFHDLEPDLFELRIGDVAGCGACARERGSGHGV